MDPAGTAADASRTSASYLRPEMAAVVDYAVAAIQGKGEPTKADCVAYRGPTARECQAMR